MESLGLPCRRQVPDRAHSSRQLAEFRALLELAHLDQRQGLESDHSLELVIAAWMD